MHRQPIMTLRNDRPLTFFLSGIEYGLLPRCGSATKRSHEQWLTLTESPYHHRWLQFGLRFTLGFRLDHRLVKHRIAKYPFERVARHRVRADLVPMARQQVDQSYELVHRAGSEIGFGE